MANSRHSSSRSENGVVPHVRSIIINAVHADRIVDFWRTILGVGILKVDTNLGVTWLQPDTDEGVTIGIQQVDQRNNTHPGIHLDVAVHDREATKNNVVELGGRVVATHESLGVSWYIVADPEDNHFCIYEE